jgi:type II secretory pathway predicted ATPase ExeA
VRLLGEGSMGAVYLAKDDILRRDVAVKLINRGDEHTDPHSRERFLREARAAARLIHPNVVQIFQVGETPEVRFIAMEYVEGMTMAAVAQRRGPLEETFGIERMREAAEALKLAAMMGICHRDIKPANLLLTTSGTLIDQKPDMDPRLAELLQQCMAKQPEERPTAAAIAERLSGILRGASRTPGELPHGRRLPAQDTPTSDPGQGSGPSMRVATSPFEQSYRLFFGLEAVPFSDVRQPASFWDAGPYASAVRSVASQITLGQSPVMLVGDPGSGRTFVCEMIQHKFPPIRVLAAEPQLLFGAGLVTWLCRQLGVTVDPGAGERSLVSAMRSAIVTDDRPDAIAALVIDGVDPDDRVLVGELSALLRNAPKNRLALVLIGDDNLPSQLAAQSELYDPAQHARPVVLRSMSQQEMLEYTTFRMTSVGKSRTGLELDTASCQLLHARSGGKPRLVNVYCHNALMLSALKGESQINFETIRLAVKSKAYLTLESASALLHGDASSARSTT